METCLLSWRNSTIHYYRTGHGPEWLFCFHGYGEEGHTFKLFEEILKDRYTIIAIDLPFHGKTDWQEGLLFPVSDLIDIINLIKPKGQSISLMGYSMGGRVALHLTQVIPEQIKKIVLIAPDGLHKNKWQWLATRTLVGNRLFVYTMRNPFWMFSLMDMAGKVGLYNKSLLKFVHYYLDDAKQRWTLYQRWITMREFRPETDLLRDTIVKNKIPVQMLFGRYDRVILTKHGNRFRKKAEKFIMVNELEVGHVLLREKYVPEIAKLLVE